MINGEWFIGRSEGLGMLIGGRHGGRAGSIMLIGTRLAAGG